jgi:hypothetical protein
MTTLNRLTQKQVWEISKNIEANIELYKDVEYKIIANAMVALCGYEVTVANIQGIKEATGLQIGRQREKPVSSIQKDIQYIANLLLNTEKWKNDEVLLSIFNKNTEQ